MNSKGPIRRRLPPQSLLLAAAIFLPRFLFPAAPDAPGPSPPPPEKGSVSRSGKFTPALPASSTNAPRITTPAEAEAVLRQALHVRQVGSNSFAIGRVEFDKQHRTVTVPARVKVRTQIIEYALVTERGKAYESLFTTDVTPIEMHLAFLLLGVRPAEVGGAFAKPALIPATNALTIDATWETNGMPVKHSLSELITLTSPQPGTPPQPMPSHPWLYNGSFFDPLGFVAEREGSIISVIRDPAALVNNAAADRDNDHVHLPNEKLLPPEGWPLRVVLGLPPGPPGPPPAKLPPWVSPITPLTTNRP